MALANSPIDRAPMRKTNRFGIKFEVCSMTGGIWLDKGQLEKLIALVKEEALEQNRGDRAQGRYPSHDGHRGDDNRDRQDSRRRSRLEDLFDF